MSNNFKAIKAKENPIFALTKNLYEKHLKPRVDNAVKQWNLERSKSLVPLKVPTFLSVKNKGNLK